MIEGALILLGGLIGGYFVHKRYIHSPAMERERLRYTEAINALSKCKREKAAILREADAIGKEVGGSE